MSKTSKGAESNRQSAICNPQLGKRILLLFTTTGYNEQDFVAAARKLGVEVVPGTDRCHVLENPWRDGALPLRFGNPQKSAERIVQYARQRPVSAVIAVGDKPTLTAALACRTLGLPCSSVEAIAACRNKFAARQLFRKAGLPVPEFSSYPIESDESRIAREVRYPSVLKPLSLSASQGVIRADSPEEFTKAFRRIARLLKTPEIRVAREQTLDQILVEDYIEGQEVALEGMLVKGQLKVLALFDKPDALDGPFFEESLYITPSRLELEVQEAIHRRCEQAANAVGLLHGPIHAEVRVNSEGVWIIELAARSIGGLCSRTLRFGTGMSLEELIIRQALAMRIPTYRRQKAAAGVMMIPIPKEGFLHEIEGVEDALALRGIQEVAITAKLGQKLVPLPEGASYLGFIFATGASPATVERRLRSAHGKLRFDITPELPVL
jgi:biotin carboxylase